MREHKLPLPTYPPALLLPLPFPSLADSINPCNLTLGQFQCSAFKSPDTHPQPTHPLFLPPIHSLLLLDLCKLPLPSPLLLSFLRRSFSFSRRLRFRRRRSSSRLSRLRSFSRSSVRSRSCSAAAAPASGTAIRPAILCAPNILGSTMRLTCTGFGGGNMPPFPRLPLPGGPGPLREQHPHSISQQPPPPPPPPPSGLYFPPLPPPPQPPLHLRQPQLALRAP